MAYEPTQTGLWGKEVAELKRLRDRGQATPEQVARIAELERLIRESAGALRR